MAKRRGKGSLIRRAGLIAGMAMLAYPLFAIALIFSQTLPEDHGGETGGLDFSNITTETLSSLPPAETYRAADGGDLVFRRYDSSTKSGNTLILLHGSGWHGMQFHRLASAIASAGAASVLVPDLRGHGFEPERRGDVDYIGQLEDDIAALIDHLRGSGNSGQLILGGHSSGGGLAVRFAGGEHGHLVDGWILLAPFLKYNAPTTRPDSGGWARPLTRRIIGLTMLNGLGVSVFNRLTVIGFNFPAAVLNGPLGHTATRSYTYRMNVSFSPRDDFEADLARIDKPFLLIAGVADEAFFADRYETVISAQTDQGEYITVAGESHLGIVANPTAIVSIVDWLTRQSR